MARLSKEDREERDSLVLADFHTGQFNQRELSKKYEVSTATINKLTKGKKPKHEHKVNTIATVTAELLEESEQEVNAVFTAIDEKTKHIKLINDNATKLARKINTMADQIDQPQDMKHLVDANDKLAVTLKVADRHAPKGDVNVQTNQTIVDQKWEIEFVESSK